MTGNKKTKLFIYPFFRQCVWFYSRTSSLLHYLVVAFYAWLVYHFENSSFGIRDKEWIWSPTERQRVRANIKQSKTITIHGISSSLGNIAKTKMVVFICLLPYFVKVKWKFTFRFNWTPCRKKVDLIWILYEIQS